MTGSDWLNHLSQDEREAFLANLNGRRTLSEVVSYLNHEFKTPYSFIISAFDWSRSPEGTSYWLDIIEKFKDVKTDLDYKIKPYKDEDEGK